MVLMAPGLRRSSIRPGAVVPPLRPSPRLDCSSRARDWAGLGIRARGWGRRAPRFAGSGTPPSPSRAWWRSGRRPRRCRRGGRSSPRHPTGEAGARRGVEMGALEHPGEVRTRKCRFGWWRRSSRRAARRRARPASAEYIPPPVRPELPTADREAGHLVALAVDRSRRSRPASTWHERASGRRTRRPVALDQLGLVRDAGWRRSRIRSSRCPGTQGCPRRPRPRAAPGPSRPPRRPPRPSRAPREPEPGRSPARRR